MIIKDNASCVIKNCPFCKLTFILGEGILSILYRESIQPPIFDVSRPQMLFKILYVTSMQMWKVLHKSYFLLVWCVYIAIYVI